ncbi:hypothetical protein HZS_1480 [Henneguya salminicola]|nr:hypothetical protein HZS_1480 [Henneguya salminicola]
MLLLLNAQNVVDDIIGINIPEKFYNYKIRIILMDINPILPYIILNINSVVTLKDKSLVGKYLESQGFSFTKPGSYGLSPQYFKPVLISNTFLFHFFGSYSNIFSQEHGITPINPFMNFLYTIMNDESRSESQYFYIPKKQLNFSFLREKYIKIQLTDDKISVLFIIHSEFHKKYPTFPDMNCLSSSVIGRCRYTNPTDYEHSFKFFSSNPQQKNGMAWKFIFQRVLFLIRVMLLMTLVLGGSST